MYIIQCSMHNTIKGIKVRLMLKYQLCNDKFVYIVIVKHKEIFYIVLLRVYSTQLTAVQQSLKPYVWDQLIMILIKYRTNLFRHNKRWDQLDLEPTNVGIFGIFNQPKLVRGSKFHCITLYENRKFFKFCCRIVQFHNVFDSLKL